MCTKTTLQDKEIHSITKIIDKGIVVLGGLEVWKVLILIALYSLKSKNVHIAQSTHAFK